MISVLKLHSMIDITTNSSSELFICKTEETEEQIRNLFVKLDELTMSTSVCNTIINKIHVTHGVDEFLELMTTDIFDYSFVSYSERALHGIIPHDLWDQLELPTFSYDYDLTERKFRKDNPKATLGESFDYADQQESIATKEYQQKLKQLVVKHKDILEPHFQNIVFVQGEENSIPYEYFDIIESRLNATRIHQG